jgi:hypothetical protein
MQAGIRFQLYATIRSRCGSSILGHSEAYRGAYVKLNVNQGSLDGSPVQAGRG